MKELFQKKRIEKERKKGGRKRGAQKNTFFCVGKRGMWERRSLLLLATLGDTTLLAKRTMASSLLLKFLHFCGLSPVKNKKQKCKAENRI